MSHDTAVLAAAYKMAAHHDTGCDCEVCEAIRAPMPASAPAEVARRTWPTVDQIGELVNAVNKVSGTDWEPSDAMRLIGALAPTSGDDSVWACNARRLVAERGLIADTAARVTPAVEVRGVVTVATEHWTAIDVGSRQFTIPPLPGATVGDAVTVTVRKG